MNSGSVYIIPDENQILEDCFYRNIVNNHLETITEFSEKYKLGYKFGVGDYHGAPCILASVGHMIVKIENVCSNVLIYIPEYVTDRQNIWFHNNINLFMKYQTIAGYRVSEKDESYKVEEIMGLSNITKAIDYGNLLYNKKVSDKYVR